MRALIALALAAALAAVAVAGLALRSADRSRQTADRTDARLEQALAQVSRYRVRVNVLERRVRADEATRTAMNALCYAARHADIPRGSDYALEVGRSIIRGITDSCDYAKIPDAPTSNN